MGFFKEIIYARLFEIGLAISLAFYGFTYFQVRLIHLAFEKVSEDSFIQFVTNTLSPFMLYVGVFIAIVGLTGMMRNARTVRDMRVSLGRALYIPPIIGFASFVVLSLYAHNVVYEIIDFSIFLNPSTYFDKQFLLCVGIFVLGIILARGGIRRKR